MNRLRELREQKKLPQKDIAALIGKTIQAYSLYELGKRNIDNDTLIALANFYNVTTDYLLGREFAQRPAELPLENKTEPLTPAEETHIKKYRRLDTDGKERIDRQIDFELYQIEQNAESKEDCLG